MKKLTEEQVAINDRCVEIWEAAVRATHHFVTEEDIAFYKPSVWEGCMTDNVICYVEEGLIVGFIGLQFTYIDMLFIHPDYRGKGIGRQLIEMAIHEHHAETVCVNEQNEQAVGFYMKMGFEVVRRTEKDERGKPYPILYLRLKNPRQRMVKVTGDKKEYLPLLLLADPSEAMVDRYLSESEMYVLEYDGKVIGEIVVDAKGEIKNIAVLPAYQRQKFGMYMVASCLFDNIDRFDEIHVGANIQSVAFFKWMRFRRYRVVKNYFTDNYPEPVYNNGQQCVDKIYLKFRIREV